VRDRCHGVDRRRRAARRAWADGLRSSSAARASAGSKQLTPGLVFRLSASGKSEQREPLDIGAYAFRASGSAGTDSRSVQFRTAHGLRAANSVLALDAAARLEGRRVSARGDATGALGEK